MKEYKFVSVRSEEVKISGRPGGEAERAVIAFEGKLNQLATQGWVVINSDLEKCFALMEKEKKE